MEIGIKKLNSAFESEYCAQLMANSEPWITLERNYEQSLKTISDPSKEVYLAYVERLAGFIIINMNGAFIGYIQSICVIPEWGGLGIGSKLLEFAEAKIFQDLNVFICVSSFNKRAKHLYENLGYETVRELRDYIIQSYSEILMRKSLGLLKEFNL